MCYHNAKVDGLHVPLMALIDYRGIRLLAVSMYVVATTHKPCTQHAVANCHSHAHSLPITKDTLRYGSHDGGYNVRASDPELNRKMEEAARRIGLKRHIVGTTEIWGPGDIEGHRVRSELVV